MVTIMSVTVSGPSFLTTNRTRFGSRAKTAVPGDGSGPLAMVRSQIGSPAVTSAATGAASAITHSNAAMQNTIYLCCIISTPASYCPAALTLSPGERGEAPMVKWDDKKVPFSHI